jgi:hypothetical protein
MADPTPTPIPDDKSSAADSGPIPFEVELTQALEAETGLNSPGIFERAYKAGAGARTLLSWVAVVLVPIVLAIYAVRADRVADRQVEISEAQRKISIEQAAQMKEQTTIQAAQTKIQTQQEKILEDQNNLISLQYRPNFSIRINADLTQSEGVRVVELYNLGAAVTYFRILCFSSLRADWYYPQQLRSQATGFGFYRTDRTYIQLRPDVIAQFRSNFSIGLINRLSGRVTHLRAMVIQ